MAASATALTRLDPLDHSEEEFGFTIYPNACFKVARETVSLADDSPAALQQHYIKLSSNDPRLQLESMISLRQVVSYDSDSISKLLELSELIPFLLRFMNDDVSDDRALEASYLLGCLCSGNIYLCGGRIAVIDAGGIDVLIGILRGLTNEDQVVLTNQVICILGNIACDQRQKRRKHMRIKLADLLIEKGLVDLLSFQLNQMGFLRTSIPSLKIYIWCLANLIQSASKHSMGREGSQFNPACTESLSRAISPLIACFTSASDEELLIDTSRALADLCIWSSDELFDILASQMSVLTSVLVRLLQSFASKHGIVTCCLQIIDALVERGAAEERITELVQAGLLPLLLHHLASCQVNRRSILGALQCIIQNSQSRVQLLMESAGFDTLMKQLECGPEDDTEAARVLLLLFHAASATQLQMALQRGVLNQLFQFFLESHYFDGRTHLFKEQLEIILKLVDQKLVDDIPKQRLANLLARYKPRCRHRTSTASLFNELENRLQLAHLMPSVDERDLSSDSSGSGSSVDGADY